MKRTGQNAEGFWLKFGDVIEEIGAMRGFYLFTWDVKGETLEIWPEAKSHFEVPENFHEGELEGYLARIIDFYDRDVVLETFQSMLRGERAEALLSFRMLVTGGLSMWVSARIYARREAGETVEISGYFAGMQRVQTGAGKKLLDHEQFVRDYEGTFDKGKEGHLLIFDIDDHKYLQECFGQEYADRLMDHLIDAVEQAATVPVRLYRLEYDRFVMVSPCTSRSQIENSYQKARRVFRDAVKGTVGEGGCSFSCGAAAFPGDSISMHGLTRYAQNALNTAKLAGKDMLVFFNKKEYERHQKVQSLLIELRRSVEAGFEGFRLEYQPQVSLETGRLCGAEALLRWSSEQRGEVSPVEFIPLLERTGLIVPVGRWVLRTALEQCRVWRAYCPELVIGVNLSYQQLEKDDIAAFARDELERAGLPGEALLLELTESEQLEEYAHFNRALEPLAEQGIAVAIDDFGTGYSSLGYFKELKIDIVKIDRCFVNRILESEYDYRLIEFIIGMVRDNDMQVCVEGVETAEELEVLRDLSPNYLQGYYFSRPVPPEQFARRFLGREVQVEVDVKHR